MASARPANFSIGILGHVDHGKTTLAKALSSVASTAAFDKSPDSRARGITLDLGFSAFMRDLPPSTDPSAPSKVQCTLVDCPGHAKLLKTVITGSAIMDAALVIVDVTTGIQVQTAECLVLALKLVPQTTVLVFSKVDVLLAKHRAKVGDEGAAAAAVAAYGKAERKMRGVLTSAGFPDDTPIVAVAATAPEVEETMRTAGLANVGVPHLLTTLTTLAGRRLTDPAQVAHRASLASLPTLFAMDHAFAIKGVGTVCTGTMLAGQVKVGDTVEFVGMGEERRVRSMQVFRQSVASAAVGDRLGLCVSQMDPSMLERGLLATPGSVPRTTAIFARVGRIRFHKLDVSTRRAYHITLGHTTVMATPFFLRRADGGAPDFANFALDSPQLTDAEYRLLDVLPEGDEETLVLLDLAERIPVPSGALVIGARLDLDAAGTACRLAFTGHPLVATTLDAALASLTVTTPKEYVGTVDRYTDKDRCTAIVRGLVAKGRDPSFLVGRTVTHEPSGLAGTVVGPFGQSGKMKVSFRQGIPANDQSKKVVYRFTKPVSLKK
jgi:selenocysteine-specific elongation factor